jgi:hypothetical protein
MKRKNAKSIPQIFPIEFLFLERSKKMRRCMKNDFMSNAHYHINQLTISIVIYPSIYAQHAVAAAASMAT